MTTENLVNCHCQLSITIGHGVKLVKVKLVKVGFALQLLQLQLEKHGVTQEDSAERKFQICFALNAPVENLFEAQ
jgi:hypothetical protein